MSTAKGDCVDQGKRASEEIFDREDLLNTIDGDIELLNELVGAFLSTVPQEMESIRIALGRSDYSGPEREAHKLKGTSANMRAVCLAAAFSELQHAIKQQDAAEARRLFATCEVEFERFKELILGQSHENINYRR